MNLYSGHNKRVVCADGASMSVQASRLHYCTPEDDEGPYTAVEVGYPSGIADEEFVDAYAHQLYVGQDITPRVPVYTILSIIERHGGMVEGELPRFV